MWGVRNLKNLFSRNKRMIAGNWKSNFTANQATEFVQKTIQPLKFNPDNVGTLPFTQMSSFRPCSCTFRRSWPWTPTNKPSTKWQPKTAPTTALGHTPAKSVPNTSLISASNGSSLDILNAGPSWVKRTNSSCPRPNSPSKLDSKSSTASDKPSKVPLPSCRTQRWQNLESSRLPARSSFGSLPQRLQTLAL